MSRFELLVPTRALQDGEDVREFVRTAALANKLPVRRLSATWSQLLVGDLDRFDDELSPHGFSGRALRRGLNSIRYRRKICASCRAEDLPSQAYWYQEPVSFCLVHGLPLSHRCTYCSSWLSFDAEEDHVCHGCSRQVDLSPQAAHSNAEMLHRAAFLDTPPIPLGSEHASIEQVHRSPAALMNAVERLARVHTLNASAATKTSHLKRHELISAWSADAFENLVERVAISARRLRHDRAFAPRKTRKFPTGWRYLDEKVETKLDWR